MLYVFLAAAIIAYFIGSTTAAIYIMVGWSLLTLFIFTFSFIAAFTRSDTYEE